MVMLILHYNYFYKNFFIIIIFFYFIKMNKKKKIQNIHIGTSGIYMDIKEYQKYLNMVEINVTFYHIPKEEIFIKWYNNTNKNFKFTLKAPSFLTHKKKLLIDDDFIKVRSLFWNNSKLLKNKLSYILFQLPSYLRYNDNFINKINILANFLPKFNYVFEFRNIEFYNDYLFSLFNKYKFNISTILINNKDGWIRNLPKDINICYGNNMKYIRLHGSTGQYIGSYKKDFNKILKLIDKDSCLIFNNTDNNDAFNDAVYFLNKLLKL